MSSEWQPGTVAMVTWNFDGQPRTDMRFRYLRKGIAGYVWEVWESPDGTWIGDATAKEVRPLVVIDPEDREQVERLCGVLASVLDEGLWTSHVQAALREFADPKPRIEEPEGWLSAIRDDEGVEWYRWSVRPKDRDQAWLSVWDEGRCYPTGWNDINAVEVLSEGVLPDEPLADWERALLEGQS